MQQFNSRTLSYLFVAALVIAIGAVSQPALAQSAQPSAKAENQAAAKVQQLRAEAQKIGMQLNEIESKAIASDKALQAEREHFAKHLMKAMQTIGYHPKADTKQLAEIKKKVLSGKLSKQEREKQIRKFQAIRANLFKGQMAAMQDKGLRQERQKLGQDMMVAMKKQDPHTEALLKQFAQINKQLQRMFMDAQQRAHAAHK